MQKVANKVYELKCNEISMCGHNRCGDTTGSV